VDALRVPKSAVITGCSSGFGRVTSLHLAQNGWQVFATVRSETDRDDLLAEAHALGCREYLAVLLCDVTREEQVGAMAAVLTGAVPRLNALVNNAGAAFPAPLELLPLDALRSQLEINVVGQLAVTQALLPLLKAARGTIVNVSSESGRVVFPITGAYHMSKFALEAMSDVLRIELAPFGVRVVVLQPGASLTAIWATSRQRALAGMAGIDASAYTPLIEAVAQAADRRARAGFSAQAFAETVLKILNSDHPRARYAIPWQTGALIALRRLLPDASWDWLVRGALKW
jgi:NAD(P)-dependent dehydrogenase (short-subunit alcohol dehydrogenase family)